MERVGRKNCSGGEVVEKGRRRHLSRWGTGWIGTVEGSEPSGCSFWRLAAAGKPFYTVPENHFNCAVGAYTHNIPLSAERQRETEQTLKMMFDLGYVKAEEVPQIPRLAKTPQAIAYAPLGESPFAPDAVLFACKPVAAMLLNEAAGRAGVGCGAPVLGRPTCMALPAVVNSGSIVSLGCMGNRVYTGLGEDELYFVVRGNDLAALADALDVITGCQQCTPTIRARTPGESGKRLTRRGSARSHLAIESARRTLSANQGETTNCD